LPGGFLRGSRYRPAVLAPPDSVSHAHFVPRLHQLGVLVDSISLAVNTLISLFDAVCYKATKNHFPL
jgi:hypothetical protein